MTQSATLRAQLADSDTPVIVPGGGTPLEALAVQAAGFGAFYLSGYAVAAWRHGLPDIGLLGASDTVSALHAVTRVTSLPVIVDADTAYGDVTSVFANVRLLEAAGAAAIQIEDQVWPKKCGHMANKAVIDADEAVRKIAAAVEARRDPETMIIARTDSLAPHGLDDALSRAQRFHDVGADIVFIDAPTSVAELSTIGSTLPAPIMANMTESGLTPLLSAQQFHDLGFQLIIYPAAPLRVASRQLRSFLAELRESGDSTPWSARMDSLDELNELVSLPEYLSFDAIAAS